MSQIDNQASSSPGRAQRFERIRPLLIAAEAFERTRRQVVAPSTLAVFDKARGFFDASLTVRNTVLRAIAQEAKELNIATDPLALPWGRCRQVRDLNENAYSDRLAWTFEIVQSNGGFGHLISTLFPSGANAPGQVPCGPARILRETPVAYGHAGRTGRTDLQIEFLEDMVVYHIEVKVSAAESADLGKNNGYVNDLIRRYPQKEIRNFLLVTAANCLTYGDGKESFSVVTWAQLCQRMRGWIASRSSLGLLENQCLMFCGLVEHCLLQISYGSLAHLHHLRASNVFASTLQPARSS